MSDGFEAIVTQGLGRIESSIAVLFSRVSSMEQQFQALKAEWETLQRRNERLQGPLQDWTVDDSVRLKAILEKERAGEFNIATDLAKAAKSDRKLQQTRDRLYIGITILS